MYKNSFIFVLLMGYNLPAMEKAESSIRFEYELKSGQVREWTNTRFRNFPIYTYSWHQITAYNNNNEQLGFIKLEKHDPSIIRYMFVHENARKKGVGKALLKKALEYAQRNKISGHIPGPELRDYFQKLGAQITVIGLEGKYAHMLGYHGAYELKNP